MNMMFRHCTGQFRNRKYKLVMFRIVHLSLVDLFKINNTNRFLMKNEVNVRSNENNVLGISHNQGSPLSYSIEATLKFHVKVMWK